MYKTRGMSATNYSVNQAKEGETIERKLERITSNKEPITEGAPLIYTERDEGVKASYDIRTDRFEVAVEGMDTVYKSQQARRDAKMKIVKDDDKTDEKGGETSSVDGTENN